MRRSGVLCDNILRAASDLRWSVLLKHLTCEQGGGVCFSLFSCMLDFGKRHGRKTDLEINCLCSCGWSEDFKECTAIAEFIKSMELIAFVFSVTS